MHNLTYYLGAGASAGTKERPAIPILLGFNEKLRTFFNELIIAELKEQDPLREHSKLPDENFLDELEKHIPLFRSLANNESAVLFDDNFIYFITQVNQILADLNDHTTVDTLARKYHLLEDQSKLVNLKAFLSIYFLHLQHNERRFDMRYDSFVSTMLERRQQGSLELPNNVKIVSWNYDLQFEMALKKYQKVKLNKIQEQFGIHPSKSYCTMSKGLGAFGMAKLNGTAGLFFDLSRKLVRDIDEIYPNKIKRNELFDLFFGICRGGDYSISPFYRYSWEDDNERYDKLTNMKSFLTLYAKDIMKNSNHLVVIGYSFPPFNRRVDIELFNCLPQNAVVYIQDMNPVRKRNVEDIFRNFETKNIKVEFIEDVSQFHIPPVYFEE